MTTQTGEAVEPTTAARVSMLRMATAWQTRGKINQAVDAYTQLLRRYPDTAEAREAAGRILALAQAYEQQGRYRLALSLYQKLERLSGAPMDSPWRSTGG